MTKTLCDQLNRSIMYAVVEDAAAPKERGLLIPQGAQAREVFDDWVRKEVTVTSSSDVPGSDAAA